MENLYSIFKVDPQLKENYNFKAPISIIYKTDMYELLSSPIKHDHADSFIGITLLETSGDYFDLYWDNDATDFLKTGKKYSPLCNQMR